MIRKALLVVAALALAACSNESSSASTSSDDMSEAPKGEVLALGDSITFGFDPSKVDPTKYRGYAEMVADSLGVGITNGSCPGEATGHFLAADGQDRGCKKQLTVDKMKLHVDWGTDTQLEFTTNYLRKSIASGRPPSLITMTIGANDIGIMSDECQLPGPLGAACMAARYPFFERSYRENLEKIFLAIDATGYRGPMIMVTTYVLDYADFGQTFAGVHFNGQVQAAFDNVRSRLHGLDVRVADGYGAFKKIADASGGDTCKTGLRLPLGDGTCDIHPTPRGHELLAQAVRDALH
jgi:lysophospholipase L1-like esterase